MIEIKKVEYDDVDTCFNESAVCPYCGEENYVEGEYYKGQDEEDEMECSNCEKTFIFTINYSVTFSSEPYENWVLKQMEYFERRMSLLHKCLNEAPEQKTETYLLDKEYYKTIIEYEETQIDEFKRRVKEVLGNDFR